MSSGGRASDLSLITSTAVPPRPNTTTGPKVGSSARPAISSRPRGRWIIGCTVTPSMTASGRSWRDALQHVPRGVHRPPCSLDRFSATPPTSDLCAICCDRIFTATACPCAQEAGGDVGPASSGVAAARTGATGMSVGLQHRGHGDRDRASARPSRAVRARARGRARCRAEKPAGRLGGISIRRSCAFR